MTPTAMISRTAYIMCNRRIETKLTHLGVTRDNTSAHLTVEDRISTARRAMYALMGAGLHRVNGLPVSTYMHLFNTFTHQEAHMVMI